MEEVAEEVDIAGGFAACKVCVQFLEAVRVGGVRVGIKSEVLLEGSYLSFHGHQASCKYM